MNEIVVHYAEIALKGGNRKFFEKKLMRALRTQMQSLGIPAEVKRSWGRLFIQGAWGQEDIPRIRGKLSLTPGIAHFGFVQRIAKDEQALEEKAKELLPFVQGSVFRVSSHRVDKNFPLDSRAIEKKFALALFAEDENLQVDLRHFEKEIIIKVLESEILIFLKEKGIGGLPIGSSGKAISLLSAGFDSPVASFLLMKRGVEVFPLHFHADELTGKDAVEAVEELAEKLSFIQGKTVLALISTLAIQKYIAQHAPEKLRIVLLRRSFNRIANRYAQARDAKALVSGESVGQVASQTLENMLVTHHASELPILTPLSGMNKNEIIAIARKIDTADISARPCEDTCSLFVPEHPETKANLGEVERVEQELLSELPRMEEEAFREVRVRIFGKS